MDADKKKIKNSLAILATLPVISIILGFLVTAVISLLFVQSEINKAHRNQLIVQAANSIQWRINQKQIELVRQLQAVANSQSLVDLLRSKDADARLAEEKRLAQSIPHATRVLLFRLAEAQINRDVDPPFNYTSLDLLNRAEQGTVNLPEAVKSADGWLITAAVAIRTPSDQKVHGSMFVYLELSVLSDLARSLPGQILLVQSFGNLETEFLSVGSSSSTLQLRRDLPNSYWQLRFNPSEQLTSATVGGSMIYLIPGVVACIVILIGMIFSLTWTLARLNEDSSQLARQIGDASKDRFDASDSYFFPQFSKLDDQLSKFFIQSEAKDKSNDSQPLAVVPKPENQMVAIEMIEDSASETTTNINRPDDQTPLNQEIDSDDDIDIADIALIFRAYDIRGVVGETMTASIVKKIGLSIGTEAKKIGEQTLIVAADGRLSSPTLLDALIEGLSQSGRDVVNIGFVPTPLLYYATCTSEIHSGVMITGSHNPANHNGLKVVFDGRTLLEDEIQTLYQTFLSQEFSSGEGRVSEKDIREQYLAAISDDVVVAEPLKVVVDCGNGIAGELAPRLLARLGCEVVPLYCEVDGEFPNHHPDPINPANLQDLIHRVTSEGADIGIALDGDGDRMVAVTKNGDIVWPDRLLMLFAKDVISRNPGSDVIYDVKCTRHLNSLISDLGGRPIICRTGHSFLKAKMLETGAILGGEMSGHICFKERWYGFDDGLYSAARLLEILGSESAELGELLEEFPVSVTTPEIQVQVGEDEKFSIIKQLIQNAEFEDATLNTLDGLRVEYSDRWGLVRASNTNACLTLRFEADDEEGLSSIQALFRDKLTSIDTNLTF